MSTFLQKLSISVFSAILFIVVSLPQTYELTNSISPVSLFNKETNCPTVAGIMVHTFVFFLLTLLSMSTSSQPFKTKLKHSIYGTLIFFLFSNPVMYKFTNSILHTSSNGCPNMIGIFVHALVFCVALIGVMYL